MKGYQKERLSVNGSIEVMDMEPLVELASEGLLALSLQVGLEVFRQMLARDVTALAGAKGDTTQIGAPTGTGGKRRAWSWADKKCRRSVLG